MRSSRSALVLGLLAVLALVGAACGNDDSGGSSSPTATATATSTPSSGGGNDPSFVRLVQEDLRTVGCYSGEIDGEDGPETQAAIRAFQEAEGLTVDGEVGDQTLAALESAAAAGTQVCGGSPSPTPTPTPGGGQPTNPCEPITEDEVQQVTGMSSITTWTCVADANNAPWVGGSGVEGGSADANFILEGTAAGALIQYTGSCANPPVPDSLLQYCEAS